MITTTHTEDALNWIDNAMHNLGVSEYRFCKENDCYICDKSGNFYSVCHRQFSRTGNLINNYRIQKLRGSIDKDGYATYRICESGIKKHLKGHRLMLNAWVGEERNLVVNHKDGNKKNNSLDNLEWCTVAENNAHAIKTGLFNPHSDHHRGHKIPLHEWMTIYILYKHCGYSLSQLGRMNNCVHDTIKRIIERIDGIMPKEVLYG